MSRFDIEIIVLLLTLSNEFKDVNTFTNIWLSMETSTDGSEDIIASNITSVCDIIDSQ
jgi:hypothetical protein